MIRTMPYDDNWVCRSKYNIGAGNKMMLPYEKTIYVSAANDVDNSPAVVFSKNMKIPKTCDENVYLLFLGNSTVTGVKIKDRIYHVKPYDGGVCCDITYALKYGIAKAEILTCFKKKNENEYFCSTGNVMVGWQKQCCE